MNTCCVLSIQPPLLWFLSQGHFRGPWPPEGSPGGACCGGRCSLTSRGKRWREPSRSRSTSASQTGRSWPVNWDSRTHRCIQMPGLFIIYFRNPLHIRTTIFHSPLLLYCVFKTDLLCVKVAGMRRSVIVTYCFAVCCEGEDLVSEPEDEMEELQGERAAVDRRLPPADPPHQNQPPPRPHRCG